jgi:hypothetical protein
MKKILTGALAALTLAGGAFATAAPASAQAWRGGYHGGYGYRGGGYYRGGHYGAGAALGAGLLGLAVGAAIAGGPHYYYAPPPAYYVGPSYYYAGPRCRMHYRWDPYWGRYVAAQRCW